MSSLAERKGGWGVGGLGSPRVFTAEEEKLTADFTARGRRLGSLFVSIKVMSATLMHKDAVSSYPEACRNTVDQCHTLTGWRAAADTGVEEETPSQRMRQWQWILQHQLIVNY